MGKFERYLYLAIIIGLIIWAFKDGCHKCPVCKDYSNDTIRIHDTLSAYLPSPVFVEVPKYITKQVDSQAIKDEAVDRYIAQHQFDPAIPDTAWRILADYAVNRSYYKTYSFKYGSVKVIDKVTHNKLESQRVIPDFNIPTVIETKHDTITAKRFALYAGIDAGMNGQFTLGSVGPSLLLKDRQDNLYKVGARFSVDFKPMYEIGFYRKIKLK